MDLHINKSFYHYVLLLGGILGKVSSIMGSLMIFFLSFVFPDSFLRS